MALRDIMTARVVTVEMDDRLEVVKEIYAAGQGGREGFA